MSVKQGCRINELEIGMSAERRDVITEKDVLIFAELTGDKNPVHLDEEYAKSTVFKTRIAHGALSASFISALLGCELPGTGAVIANMMLRFRRPVYIGAELTTRTEVIKINERRRRVTLKCQGLVEGKRVLDGEAEVVVPAAED